MTGLINGTTAGSGFSQLKVTGSAALAGTINFTVAAGFQGSLTLGETFKVLTASSVTGTFSNTTIAINSTFHFNVSYTATGVVLTVASGHGTPGEQSGTGSRADSEGERKASRDDQQESSRYRQSAARVSGVSKTSKPILVAGLARSNGRSNAILARRSELNLRSWEHIPTVSVRSVRPVAVAVLPRAGTLIRRAWSCPR